MGYPDRGEGLAIQLGDEAMWVIPLRIMLDLKVTRSALILRIRVVVR
jgi:hypothetical protein